MGVCAETSAGAHLLSVIPVCNREYASQDYPHSALRPMNAAKNTVPQPVDSPLGWVRRRAKLRGRQRLEVFAAFSHADITVDQASSGPTWSWHWWARAVCHSCTVGAMRGSVSRVGVFPLGPSFA